MAKENKKGVAEVAPLFPLEKKQWTVIESFYDQKQERLVSIGEIVEHTERREKLNLIK